MTITEMTLTPHQQSVIDRYRKLEREHHDIAFELKMKQRDAEREEDKHREQRQKYTDFTKSMEYALTWKERTIIDRISDDLSNITVHDFAAINCRFSIMLSKRTNIKLSPYYISVSVYGSHGYTNPLTKHHFKKEIEDNAKGHPYDRNGHAIIRRYKTEAEQVEALTEYKKILCEYFKIFLIDSYSFKNSLRYGSFDEAAALLEMIEANKKMPVETW
jgi:hypothetical protein